MKQQNFSDFEYSNRKKKTKREEFLNAMDEWIPWDSWTERIRPYYYSGKRGRPPKDLETMLRMYLLKIWFGLSDAGVEDAIYDSYAMRDFMHLDFLDEQVPGSSTLRRFSRLIEKEGIADALLKQTTERIRKEGYVLHRVPISDATLTALPKKKNGKE